MLGRGERAEPRGEVEREAEERLFAGRQRGGDGLSEGEAQGQLGFARVGQRLIPALGILWTQRIVGRPLLPGEGLEGEAGDALRLRAGDDLRTEVAGVVGGEVHRHEDRVEVEAIHRREGRLDGMGGEPEMPDLSGAPGLDEDLHRPARGEGRVEVLGDVGDGVELIEVEIIGAQRRERVLQFGGGAGAEALGGLAGEEAVAPVGLERGAEFHLGVAVAGGDVEVVHAALDELGDDAVGVGLVGIHHHDAAHADDRERDRGLAVGAPRQARGVGGGVHRGRGLRPGGVNREGRGRQGGRLEEVAPRAAAGTGSFHARILRAGAAKSTGGVRADDQDPQRGRAGVPQTVPVAAAGEAEVAGTDRHGRVVEGHLPHSLEDVIELLVAVVPMLADAGARGDGVVVDQLDAGALPRVIAEHLLAPQAAAPAVAVARFAELHVRRFDMHAGKGAGRGLLGP